MSTAADFIRQQLASTGWAPIHYDIAGIIDPATSRDHQSFTAFQNTPSALIRSFPRTRLYKAQVPDFGEVLVLARNEQFLAERMAWLGFPASSVTAVKVDRAPIPEAKPARAIPKADEAMERLRALANQRMPEHDCTLRREIQAAKAALEPSRTAEPAVSP